MKEHGLYTNPNEDSFISRKEIVDALTVFPDKKTRWLKFDEVAQSIQQAQELLGKWEIGQREATWEVKPERPDLPIMILLMTDTHFGSTRVDYDLLTKHLDMIENTPNMYLIHNGDHVDNFNATGKWASGMMENPYPPQVQARAYIERMQRLDDKGKIGVMSFGNHDDFARNAGQDWYDSFLGNFKCPVFTSGGLLHIVHKDQLYNLGMTHKYWGTSKLNPTNACKRYMNFEEPNADIIFLGHTHQSEGLQFEVGGKPRVAVIGGTYKLQDEYARKNGIGGRAGSPGWAVALWGEGKKMQLFNDVGFAKEVMEVWKDSNM